MGILHNLKNKGDSKMYFPQNMNFQYFFFDTYPGYFLQALPIAIIAGIIYAIYSIHRTERKSALKITFSTLFVTYIAAILYLTVFMDIGSNIYYRIFYHMPSGNPPRWFKFEYFLIPNRFLELDAQNIGNIIMFLPFGILYPLFDKKSSLKRSILAGVLTSFAIEFIQPIFGRIFDINDVILNSFGAIISAIIFYMIKFTAKRIKKQLITP